MKKKWLEVKKNYRQNLGHLQKETRNVFLQLYADQSSLIDYQTSFSSLLYGELIYQQAARSMALHYKKKKVKFKKRLC